jgi:nucleotidyltransferase/DNA polymerase involved in DNA repair
MGLLEEYAVEQASIDEAYLDSTRKITDSSVKIEECARKIKDTIKQQCMLLSSIGVASTTDKRSFIFEPAYGQREHCIGFRRVSG